MRRLPSLAVAMIVLVSGAASGCDRFGDDNAATINGKAIASSQVTGLARALMLQQKEQCATALAQLSQATAEQAASITSQCADSKDAVVDSSVVSGQFARQALQLLVQFAVAEGVLRDLHETIQAEERTEATKSAAVLTHTTAKVRGVLEEGLAAESALERVITDHFDTKLGRAVLDAVYASRPSWDDVCAVGLVGLASDRASADAEVAKGTTIEAMVATPPTGFQALGDGGELCTPKGGSAPADIVAAWADTSNKKIQLLEFDQPSSDSTAAPTKELLVFVAKGERNVKRGTDEFKTLAAQTLQQQAAAARAGSSTAPSPVMPAAVKLATIKIDPRYGHGFDLTKGITAPAAPTVAATATSTTLGPATGTGG